MDAAHINSSAKKTALLHYWLIRMRGGEFVLDRLCRMFPDADIYTHACLPEKLSEEIQAHPIRESLIASMPFGRSHCQKYLPLMPYAQKKWDFSGYEQIISSESGPVKGIVKPPGCRHICYCHTPMRYLWDMYAEYYAAASLPAKIAMSVFKNYLRNYDLKSAECVDQFLANSAFVANRIKRIYNRDARVVYPPVHVEYFNQAPEREKKYYLFVGHMICYKQPDLAVRTFASMQNRNLILVGEGPMLRKLKKTATPNVRFISHASLEELRDLYAGAKALLFPGVEDFGIIPVEAQAAGCPVIAWKAGGALETVTEKTGIFFDRHGVRGLAEAIEELEAKSIRRTDLIQNASKFSAEHFEAGIRSVL